MTPEETVDAFIAAVTGGDTDRAAELAADDIVYDNIGFTPAGFQEALPTVNGSKAMLEFLAPMQNAEWTVHRQMSSGGMVFNERTDRFTFGETRIELPVAGVFVVVDEKITVWRDYFDLQTMTNQMAGT